MENLERHGMVSVKEKIETKRNQKTSNFRSMRETQGYHLLCEVQSSPTYCDHFFAQY
jgi:hypothetical protein